MIRHMALENIFTSTKLSMKASGLTINSMVMVEKFGQMDHALKVSIRWAKKMGREDLFGVMVLSTMGTSKAIRYVESALMFGPTRELILVTGLIIKCREKESLSGLMEESMKVNTTMTKKKALEYLAGQMVRNMQACGKMESNMAKVPSLVKRVKQEVVFGKEEREYVGRMKFNNEVL
jgi:hypothetical protein